MIKTQKAHKYNCERRDTARTGECASRRWRQRRLMQVHLVPRARLTYPNGWTTFAPPPRPPRLWSPTVHDGTRTRYTPTEMRSRVRVGFFSPLPLFFFIFIFIRPHERIGPGPVIGSVFSAASLSIEKRRRERDITII